MSVLDKTFTFVTTNPSPWGMDATLTGTRLPGLPAFVATASGAPVTYVPGSPATITFEGTLVFQHPGPTSGKPVTVTLLQSPGSVYNMTIVLPAKTVNCVANVDAASGVVYGSQGTQFVTLVLKVGAQG